MAYLPGKTGKVTIGGTSMPCSNWQFSEKTDGVDTSNTTQAGKRTNIDGLSRVDASFDCFWDTSVNPFSNSPTLQSGTNVDLNIFAHASDATPIFDSPTFFVESVDVDGDVSGAIKYSVKGYSNGAYTLDNGGGS